MIIIVTINLFICFILSKVINPHLRLFRIYSFVSIVSFVASFTFISIINPYAMLVLLMIFLAIYILGRREYLDLELNEVFIEKENCREIKAIFFADSQFDLPGSIFNEAYDNVINLINEQNADLLLLGGDYLNQAENIHLVMSKLKKINLQNFKYGAYAVMGNHDYVNYQNLITEFEQIGIKCLENDYVNIDPLNLTIVGIVDPWRNQPDYDLIMKINDQKQNTIVLAHQPDAFDYLAGEYDLMLSGHYHAGQVNFIFGMKLNSLIAKYIYGRFTNESKTLYVSSGVGGSIGRFKYSPYLRFLAKPQIDKIIIGENNEKKSR